MSRSLAVLLAAAGLLASAPASASYSLVDSSGLEYFFEDNVSSVSSSYGSTVYTWANSASAAASDATYTAAVPTTTTSGASTSTTLGDAFDGYNGIIVNGTPYYNNGAAAPIAGCSDREYQFNTQTIGDLEVQRRVFVPDTDTFARWLTTITNTSGSAVTVEVDVRSNMGSDDDTIVLGSSSGDTVAASDDTWFATGGDYDDPRVAHVLGNPSGAVQASEVEVGAEFNGSAYADQLRWVYSFEVAAGETASVLNFVSGQPTNDAAVTAGSYLEGLPAGTLACMTAEEFAAVVNFAVDCSAEDDQCSAGVYDPVSGECQAAPANEGESCDDGDVCTLDDVCSAGVCAGEEDPECGGDDGGGDDGGGDDGGGDDGTGDDGGDVDGGEDGDAGDDGGGGKGGSCAVASGGAGSLAALLLVGAAVGRRRRR